MLLRRSPRPDLVPFVKFLWVSDQATEQRSVEAQREHVLPTGMMHLVVRISDQPLRLYDGAEDASGHGLGFAVVGGARSTYYVRDISKPSCSVGALLRPGAAEVLLGLPADEIAGHHVRLEDVWGSRANFARERLLEARLPERQLAMLETLLASRLRSPRGLHPAVAQALERFKTVHGVQDAVARSGYSHRQFITRFRRAVGLTPKLYCRVLRFQKVLSHVTTNRLTSWADLALAAGYSDQPHFNREFGEFTGVTPGEYRRILPALTHHLPVSPDLHP